ncbi:MAG: hypothetical protein L6R36_008716, partial [Xanthoria steineri]
FFIHAYTYREEAIATFQNYLQLIPQVTETSEQAAKDRLVSLGTLCADKITDSDVDTFIDLLQLYCRSTAVQAVLQITTAIREKLASEGAEGQLRQKVAYLDLEDDEVVGEVLAELVALKNRNGELE